MTMRELEIMVENTTFQIFWQSSVSVLLFLTLIILLA